MSDSSKETNDPATNVGEYSVSELSGALKRAVEDRFGHVRVRGEISGYRGPHSSGHSYFALKDDRARLEAVIWRGVASKLKHLPEEGLEVIATGKLTTYPGSSKYQIVIDGLEPAGAGALMALLEERKKKLEAEGLFAPERKQLLPDLPRIIGVVTSPTGAVIRDVLHRLSDRFPLHVIVWPVRVQGDTSGNEVARAINGFNSLHETSALPKPDLLIVARGGGSIEDLWGFNDEAAVRAVANSEIPVISAIGHETDWTLIDLAADIRAPTPTGAAEIAVPVKADLLATNASLAARLKSSLSRSIDRNRTSLRAAQRGLATPDSLLALPRRRLDEAAGRLQRGLELASQKKRSDFQKIIGRGFASPEKLFNAPRQNMEILSKRLGQGLRSTVRFNATRLEPVSRRLTYTPLESKIVRSRSDLSRAMRQVQISHRQNMDRIRSRLVQADRLIETLSHKRVLERGYAVIFNDKRKTITSVDNIKSGDSVTVGLKDGEFVATAQKGAVRSNKPVTKKKSAQDQGNLF